MTNLRKIIRHKGSGSSAEKSLKTAAPKVDNCPPHISVSYNPETYPRVERELVMLAASFSRSPSAPEVFCLKASKFRSCFSSFMRKDKPTQNSTVQAFLRLPYHIPIGNVLTSQTLQGQRD